MANYGQLFFQNFEVTPLSAIARPIGTLFLILYLRKRTMNEIKQCSANNNTTSHEV